jgi:hypothetical protein
VAAIKALNLSHIQRTGYANLKCIHVPGCPAEIQPFRPDEELSVLRPQERAIPGAWKALFLNDDVRIVIAQPCYVQFAVSKGKC